MIMPNQEIEMALGKPVMVSGFNDGQVRGCIPFKLEDMTVLNILLSNINQNDLYDNFEKEFGRTLSPMEYDIINSWLDSGMSKEIIISALKEAVFNGVNNLRYIDKILFEWGKKGIKNPSDIEKLNKKQEEEKTEPYYEYDWLNED